MGLSTVKDAIATDLKAITGIKNIYKVDKNANQIDATKRPALVIYPLEAPMRAYDEASRTFSIIFGIEIYVASSKDLLDSGKVDDELFRIFEGIVAWGNDQSSTTFALSEVQEIEVQNWYPSASETNGWALVPVKIAYNP